MPEWRRIVRIFDRLRDCGVRDGDDDGLRGHDPHGHDGEHALRSDREPGEIRYRGNEESFD